jgi:curli biogenesis system outer membrane secretion channel CsgG
MRRYAFITAALLIVSSVLMAQERKKRVAVLDFEYGTVSSFSTSYFGTNVDVGKGIVDMLVTQLVKDGKYSVIERKQLDKILSEQNFSNSDRANNATAAKLGKILGVDAIIVGSVTQFGRDDKSVGVGGGAFGGFGSKYGLGRVGKKEAKAVVGINARMIDTETGEILTVAEGIGQSDRSGLLVGGAGGGGGAGAGGAVSMASSNFAQTILGEATNKAVQDVAVKLAASASSIPQKTIAIEGLVADVSGNSLVLNIGSKSMLRVGDRLSVERSGREIRDPASGKVIRRMTTRLGDITITEVDQESSVGTFSGTGPVKVGDIVKNN